MKKQTAKQAETAEMTFEPLDILGSIRLFEFALIGIGHNLKQVQDDIIRVERFGRDAMTGDIDTYKPGRTCDLGELIGRVVYLNDYAANIHKMMVEIKDQQTKQSVQAFLNR